MANAVATGRVVQILGGVVDVEFSEGRFQNSSKRSQWIVPEKMR
jgi:hypothetical protein